MIIPPNNVIPWNNNLKNNVYESSYRNDKVRDVINSRLFVMSIEN